MKPDSYKWDGDSRDERESEFIETGFSPTRGGAVDSTWAPGRMRRRRERRAIHVFWIVLVAVLLSALALYAIASRLRG